MSRRAVAAAYHAAKLEHVSCGVCGSSDGEPVCLGDRHGLGLVWFGCRRCGHVYLRPAPDEAWWRTFYRARYWSIYFETDEATQVENAHRRARQLLTTLRPWIPSTPFSYLDFGCGSGAALVEMARAFPQSVGCGVEPSDSSRTLAARRTGAAIHAELPPGPFDLITLNHVLEHDVDPCGTLTALASTLSADGRLYVETPDLRSEAWHGPDFLHIAHLQAFTSESLTTLVERCGLEVERRFVGPIDEWPWAIGLLCRRRCSPNPPAPQVAATGVKDLQRYVALRMRFVAAPVRHTPLERVKRAAVATIDRCAPRLGRTLRRLLGRRPAASPVRIDARAVEGPVERPAATLNGAAPSTPDADWLTRNRVERMDATVAELFAEDRRAFHLARYQFAASLVGGMRVVDAASGTGYGTELLRRTGAAAVTGVEIDAEAVEYSRRRHAADGVEFLRAAAEATGLPTGQFDAVVSFETIEHVEDDGPLVAEFHRLLRPGGLLICSTPNEWPLEVAPFHTRTYDLRSFAQALEPYFCDLQFWNQNSGGGSPFNRGQPAGVVRTIPENEGLAECYIVAARRRER